MGNRNFLNSVEADESLKAFIVSLCRYIVKDPSALLILDRVKKLPGDHTWTDLYEQLKDQESIERFANNLRKDTAEYDWSEVEKTYVLWGQFGWITNNTIVPFAFWDTRPASPKEADKLVLKRINKKKFLDFRAETRQETTQQRLFDEACICFDSRCYTACAMLLISMIDGELIRSKANVQIGNRKTGLKAGKRIVTEVSKDENYGLPGLFHLNLLNFESFIGTMFESADGFKHEPNHINRNYLQHGMSKRKVLRKDCIKLFIAYRGTLYFSKHYAIEE